MQQIYIEHLLCGKVLLWYSSEQGRNAQILGVGGQRAKKTKQPLKCHVVVSDRKNKAW